MKDVKSQALEIARSLGEKKIHVNNKGEFFTDLNRCLLSIEGNDKKNKYNTFDFTDDDLAVKVDPGKETVKPGAAKGAGKSGAGKETVKPGAAKGAGKSGAGKETVKPGADKGADESGAGKETVKPGADKGADESGAGEGALGSDHDSLEPVR
jgi:hypothetical protein